MSVRFGASNQWLEKTTNLPDPGSFTITCWVKLKSDLNAFTPVWTLQETGTNHYTTLITKTDGISFQLWRRHGGAITQVGTQISDVNAWYFIGATLDYDSVNTAIELYWAGLSAINALNNDSGSKAGTANAPDTLQIGAFNSGAFYIDGEVCALKVWDRVLTADEVQNEALRVLPVNAISVNAFYPFDRGGPSDAARLVDYAGLATPLAQGGAGFTADAPNPPIPWGPIRSNSIIKSVPPTYPTIPGLAGGSLALGTSATVPLIAAPDRERRDITFNPNFSTFQQGDIEQTLRSLVEHAIDLQRAVEDLYGRSYTSDKIDPDGLPSHGSICDAVDGQYLHVVKAVDSTLVALRHGLARVPQGAIPVYVESVAPVVAITGTFFNSPEEIPIATKEIVYFWFDSTLVSDGDKAVVILF